MVALVRVVNESIAVVETVIAKLLNPSKTDFRDVVPAVLLNVADHARFMRIVVLDIPSLEEVQTDSAHLFAFVFRSSRAMRWAAGYIGVSYDGGDSWDPTRAQYTEEATIGLLVNDPAVVNLGNPRPALWDTYSQVIVEMMSGTLQSASRASVLAGANLLWINGELRAFSTATEIANVRATTAERTFILTDWIRGMYGTTPVDPLVGGEWVVDMTSPHVAVALPSGDDGLSLEYIARSDPALVPDGLPLALKDPYVVVGENLRPRGVAGVTFVQDATTNDWAIQFSRVTRNPNPQIFAERGVVDVDGTESFDIEIMSDGTPSATVKRSVVPVPTAPSAGEPEYELGAYTDAEQTTDFGGTQTKIYVRISSTSGTWLDGVPQLFES